MSAARKEALLQVALNFIGKLTGMQPPPIEVAPPGVLQPFVDFVARVEKVVDQHQPPAPAAPHPQLVKQLQKERDSWKDEHKQVLRDRDTVRWQLEAMRAHQANDVWGWAGDGDDHLESMGNSMHVVIRADMLRELVQTRAQREKAARDLIAEAVRALDEHHNSHQHRHRETLRVELLDLCQEPKP